MKLDVIDVDAQPWYADGLQFTCQQCGNCCTGGPGYVWVSDVELTRLATFLKMPEKEVAQKYCRTVTGRRSLKEVRTPAGQYDCIFLTVEKVEAQISTDENRGDQNSIQPNPPSRNSIGPDSIAPTNTCPPPSRRGCSIYPVRPLQCRTWPFWTGNLTSTAAWQRASEGCHGMNQGRTFSLKEMSSLRDAKDWPTNPPTSKE